MGEGRQGEERNLNRKIVCFVSGTFYVHIIYLAQLPSKVRQVSFTVNKKTEIHKC